MPLHFCFLKMLCPRTTKSNSPCGKQSEGTADSNVTGFRKQILKPHSVPNFLLTNCFSIDSVGITPSTESPTHLQHLLLPQPFRLPWDDSAEPGRWEKAIPRDTWPGGNSRPPTNSWFSAIWDAIIPCPLPVTPHSWGVFCNSSSPAYLEHFSCRDSDSLPL